MKYLCFLVDGAADAPQDILGNKTPLDVARTPTLDRMCRRGRLMRLQCIREGAAAGTEAALIEVFGGNVLIPGRAYLEAPGFGLDIAPGVQAMRANIISVADYKIVSHCAGAVSQSEAHDLLEALNADERVAAEMRKLGLRLLEGETYRHVWAIQTEDALPECYPPHENIGAAYYELMPAPWAEVMTRMADVLSDHPINAQRRADGQFEANMIWPWGGGKRVELPLLMDRCGLRGACVAGAAVARGAARLSGLDVIPVEGATADLDTDWRAKSQACLDAFADHDAVFLHLEAPDECAHAGEAKEKARAIEMADAMLEILLGGLEARGEDFRVAVFSDHYTFSDTRKHGGAPSPCLIYDVRAEERDAPRWTEAACADMPVVPGSLLWPLLAETSQESGN